MTGLVLLFAFGGCAGTWDQSAEKGIAVMATINKATAEATRGDKFCRPIVEYCRSRSDKKCEALDLCQRSQTKLLTGLAMINAGGRNVLEAIEAWRKAVKK